MIAPGISTEMIPTSLSTGRHCPVDQWGLVGPQDKTEQSVLPDPDTKEVGTDPAGPMVTVDKIQPVAEGPVGQYITRRPVGPDGMFSTRDSDQPMADGPVGQFVTRSPVGPDSRLYWAQWAQWALEGCSPSVNRISQWLLAQWASRLQPARWARP